MSQNTTISWTDATWNPTVGCSRVSPGCENCYAERLANRFRDMPEGHKLRGLTTGDGRWNGVVRLDEKALLAPMGWRKPQMVFVDSMSDLFHESLEKPEIDRVFAVMALRRHLTFQVLTKRAYQMRQYMNHQDTPECVAEAADKIFPGNVLFKEWPPKNVWLGVSVEDQQRAEERVPMLLETPAAVRFLSVEPLLGPVRLSQWLGNPGIDWVIVGGESGPGARTCNMDWILNVVARCRDAKTPCWVKQLGAEPYSSHNSMEKFQTKDRKGATPSEWPEALRVQEMPACK